MILRKLGELYRDCMEMMPDLKRNVYTGALGVGLSALTLLPIGNGYSAKGVGPGIQANPRNHASYLTSSSELRHDVAITGVSTLSRGPKDYTLPVVVNIENQGDCGESFDVKLFDVTDATTIGTKSVHLSPVGAGGMDEICDLTFTGETNGIQQFGNYVYHGDVNGDGYDDLLVTASRHGDIKGRAYLYYGGTDMDENADKVFTGENAGDYFSEGGCLGDVNGDSFPDVILGSLGYNSSQGRVYIFFGGPDMDEKVDITINGELKNSWFGRTCTTGDVNGDGYEDLFVGAVTYKTNRGRIYLYYGGDPMDTDCDLTLTGENTNDAFGWMMDASGDVDGDNLCDLVTSTRFWPESGEGGEAVGRAYLYYGGDPMDGSCDVTFTGENSGDHFGGGLEVADVDNDGRADIIIGARAYPSGSRKGRAYLYWGKAKASMSDVVDMTFEGEGNKYDNFGGDDIEVGDVNNDDYRDIAIVAFGWPKGKQRGRTYLYYGSTQADMDTTYDHTFTGIDNGDIPQFATIGDFNKDGYGDLVVGAWGYNNKQGRTWLYYGSPGDSTQLKFDWKTTNASLRKHTLRATIDPVAGEKDIADNTVMKTINLKSRP